MVENQPIVLKASPKDGLFNDKDRRGCTCAMDTCTLRMGASDIVPNDLDWVQRQFPRLFNDKDRPHCPRRQCCEFGVVAHDHPVGRFRHGMDAARKLAEPSEPMIVTVAC